jgi:hypothetical protein
LTFPFDADKFLLMDVSYKLALDKAIADLDALTMKEREIALRKAQLRETIKALSALCGRLPDINAFSLSDAIRLVISSASEGLSPIEIRGKLTGMGYDLSKYKNPLASIHTALNRMVETEEIVYMPDEDEKVEAGENMKSPVLPESPAGVEWGKGFSDFLARAGSEGQKKE